MVSWRPTEEKSPWLKELAVINRLTQDLHNQLSQSLKLDCWWISRLLKSEASYGRFFHTCESSRSSYAPGGYFVGVLPVRC
jgi:hypothetical protein